MDSLELERILTPDSSSCLQSCTRKAKMKEDKVEWEHRDANLVPQEMFNLLLQKAKDDLKWVDISYENLYKFKTYCSENLIIDDRDFDKTPLYCYKKCEDYLIKLHQVHLNN